MIRITVHFKFREKTHLQKLHAAAYQFDSGFTFLALINSV